MNNWNYLQRRLRVWADGVFGNPSLHYCFDKVREELEEIAQDPTDRTEWADALMIFMHAAARNGHTMDELFEAVEAKFVVNQARQWGPKDECGFLRYEGSRRLR